MDPKTCCICLENIETFNLKKELSKAVVKAFHKCEQNCTVAVLECGHYFHWGCLYTWSKIKWSCPYCRHKTKNATLYCKYLTFKRKSL